jgi:hypothetical protein
MERANNTAVDHITTYFVVVEPLGGGADSEVSETKNDLLESCENTKDRSTLYEK